MNPLVFTLPKVISEYLSWQRQATVYGLCRYLIILMEKQCLRLALRVVEPPSKGMPNH